MRRFLKYAIGFFVGLIGCMGFGLFFLYKTADMRQPLLGMNQLPADTLIWTDSLRMYGPNLLRQDESGLWEMVLEGNAAERGVAFGKLAKDLLYYQESVFVNQIRQIIPSDSYLKFLRFCLILFNRDLGEYVPEENRMEIYGLSLSCTPEYDEIGTPYERQLNYHAAHDIGHAMQDYMLVGCSSFAVWGEESKDGSLLVGRNFDFYVGDDFARNKLVSFYLPTEGYAFVSVGWAGMTGVLSGMNEAGLTVTLNAAKSAMPLSAAMPISILARQILQYAATIDEAYAIACEHKTFVAESILIGSGKERKAAIIEKATDKIALFVPEAERLVCTNHYQSELFRHDPRNVENIQTSDSPYRHARLNELLDQKKPLNPQQAVDILRDRFGLDGKEIGFCNEKAINQFIAHHSVVFEPEKRRMWVSVSPWQLGKYVAYDLDRIREGKYTSGLRVDSLALAADTLLASPSYARFLLYKGSVRKIRRSINEHVSLDDRIIQELLDSNPEMYYAWLLAGDYYDTFGDQGKALTYWHEALTKEIPKEKERVEIEKRIREYE